jgi:hypothetical protein
VLLSQESELPVSEKMTKFLIATLVARVTGVKDLAYAKRNRRITPL